VRLKAHYGQDDKALRALFETLGHQVLHEAACKCILKAEDQLALR